MKAATIGCGRMGAQPSARAEGTVPAGWLPLSHVEALLAVPGTTVEALGDLDEKALALWSGHYGIAGCYTDYRRLIDEIRPDVLTVATRTPAKAEIIRY